MIEENPVKEQNLINSETLGQAVPIKIEDNMVPVKNPGVTIREEIEEDGKYILFNAENELILVINPTGKFILESCSGKKTIIEIARDIEDTFSLKDNPDLISIVKEYISTLLSAKLVKIKQGELA